MVISWTASSLWERLKYYRKTGKHLNDVGNTD